MTIDTGISLIASGAAGSILTIVLTKGVTAWRVWRTTNHEIEAEDKKVETTRADVWVKEYVTAMGERVTTLESALKHTQTELRAAQSEHRDCELKHAQIQGKVEFLENDRRLQAEIITSLQTQISKLQAASVPAAA